MTFWWLIPLAANVLTFAWATQDKYCGGYMNFGGLFTIPFALFLSTLQWLIYSWCV